MMPMRLLISFELCLSCFGHWHLKERITVLAGVLRQHKFLQASRWIGLEFQGSLKLAVNSYHLIYTCWPSRSCTEIAGFRLWSCMQASRWPLWLAASCLQVPGFGCRAADCCCAMSLDAGGAWSIAISDHTILLSFPTQAEGKAVLITGCDKGFGHALAKRLHAEGFTVFAGCLLLVSNIDQSSSLIGEKCIFICSLHLASPKMWRSAVGRDHYIFHCFITCCILLYL